MPELAIALVDYDNVKQLVDQTPGDVVQNLADLIPTVVLEARRVLQQPRELLVRLYGGWIDENGRHSILAQWVLVQSSWYRCRMGGTFVNPLLITSLACRQSEILIGTVRSSARGTRQKMVDNLIAMDAVYFARDCNLPLIVFSDDDDLVPAALACSGFLVYPGYHILRRRSIDSGMNDALLRRAGITLGTAGHNG